jgi:predicted kinase
MTAERRIVMVSGPPGVGKTTIAAALADACDPSVLIDADLFWDFIRRGRIAPWFPESNDQNAVVIDAVARSAATYAAAGYPTFLDALVGPWFLGPFRRAAADCAARLDYVVLRPMLDVSLARAAGRNAGVVDAGFEAAIQHMWLAFSDLRELESHVIDTSGLSVDETVAIVAARLSGDSFSLS